MKLLITGATGLVGSILVKKAVEAGHQIHFLSTRINKTADQSLGKGFYWNPQTGEIDMACFNGVETIIHLAGASISQRWTSKNKKEIMDSRVLGTRLLVNSIASLKGDHQVKQVIGASAIGIYPSSETSLYNESYLPKADSFLEQVVLAWENEQEGFISDKISLCKLRIGLVLTAKGGVLAPMKIPTSLGLGAAFGHGKQIQSWIHIDDLVQIILNAVDQRWSGVYNAVSPNPVTQKEFSKSLAKAMNRPFFLPPVPKFLIRLVAGEMSTLVFNSQNVSASKLTDKGYQFIYPDLLLAMKSLL